MRTGKLQMWSKLFRSNLSQKFQKATPLKISILKYQVCIHITKSCAESSPNNMRSQDSQPTCYRQIKEDPSYSMSDSLWDLQGKTMIRIGSASWCRRKICWTYVQNAITILTSQGTLVLDITHLKAISVKIPTEGPIQKSISQLNAATNPFGQN